MKFENKAQRDAVIALLKTVGMKWTWGPGKSHNPPEQVEWLSLYITASNQIHGGSGGGGTSDVMGWTKDMYNILSEKKKNPPIKVGDYTATFEKGQIKVGCQTIPNSVVREVASKLID